MSSDVTVRGRVLRGAATAAIRHVALYTDLSLLRPLVPARPAAAADAEAAGAAIRSEASRVGYEDGFAAGQAAGLEASRAATAASLAQLESSNHALETAAAGLAARQAGVVADVEQHVVRMAVEIAEAILGRELKTFDAPARDALARALKLAPAQADVVARVHPGDAAALNDVSEFSIDRTVTVVADDTVEPGGCVVDAGPCRIDAQVAPALARVREVLGV